MAPKERADPWMPGVVPPESTIHELEKERDMGKVQALTASAQASSLSVAAVQVAAAEEEWEQVEVENAALSQAVTCLKDLVLEGSAQENRVREAYSAQVSAVG
ncbi:hypothetical protein UY3_00352 [Chelonia mydas]|uniref:Uncharacterized protein n=1 Tax=Chelonia mydas TaxID=8469 RepID=M7BYU7_CHEMY|nr:hypothetical protein UY3_00352 [Chelonia mydas]